jgi:Ser/Thr protein kinase RdoA (MazF antagonist)
MDNFDERIAPNTDINEVAKQICDSYKLGNYISSDFITIGYEDYNFIINTDTKKYCVKIISRLRNKEDLGNYVVRIEVVSKSEASSPKPLLIDDSVLFTLNLNNAKYDVIVFEYINGKNFYELQENPTKEELKKLAEEVAKIHKMNFQPTFTYDSWAIVNYEEEFDKKKQYLDENEKIELEELLSEFKSIDMKQLPMAFVHGDIISTNLMRDISNRLWIIDYSVSNYLPRITDLAVIGCNLCLDKDSEENTRKNIQTFIEAYEMYIPLTEYEKEAFDVFYKVANAQHILQTQFITKTDGQSSENDYWYSEGKVGLSYSKLLSKASNSLNKK